MCLSVHCRSAQPDFLGESSGVLFCGSYGTVDTMAWFAHTGPRGYKVCGVAAEEPSGAEHSGPRCTVSCGWNYYFVPLYSLAGLCVCV